MPTKSQPVRQELIAWLDQTLCTLRELRQEVEQRIEDKKELDEITGQITTEYEDARRNEQLKKIQGANALERRLEPLQSRINEIHAQSQQTRQRIFALASDLSTQLTLCAATFPQTDELCQAIGKLEVAGEYGLYRHWSQARSPLLTTQRILEQIGQQIVPTSASAIQRFPTPEGAGWEDVTLCFLSDHRVQITVQGQTETGNYQEMGMADQRTGKPNAIWETLRLFAVHKELSRPKFLKDSDWPAIEKRIERLRKVLRETFGIEGDPFEPYRERRAYRPRFHVTNSRSVET